MVSKSHQKVLAKLRRLQQLAEGAGTEGERSAAEAARRRLVERLEKEGVHVAPELMLEVGAESGDLSSPFPVAAVVDLRTPSAISAQHPPGGGYVPTVVAEPVYNPDGQIDSVTIPEPPPLHISRTQPSRTDNRSENGRLPQTDPTAHVIETSDVTRPSLQQHDVHPPYGDDPWKSSTVVGTKTPPIHRGPYHRGETWPPPEDERVQTVELEIQPDAPPPPPLSRPLRSPRRIKPKKRTSTPPIVIYGWKPKPWMVRLAVGLGLVAAFWFYFGPIASDEELLLSAMPQGGLPVEEINESLHRCLVGRNLACAGVGTLIVDQTQGSKWAPREERLVCSGGDMQACARLGRKFAQENQRRLEGAEPPGETTVDVFVDLACALGAQSCFIKTDPE